MISNDFLLDGISVREHIMKLSEKANKAFAEKLNPGVENVLGLRLPDMRELAKRISKSDWETYLSTASEYYMEERMLHGLVLGYIKPDDDIEKYLARVTRFVKIINSWSVCDTFKFAGNKKYLSAHSVRIWEYLKTFIRSDKEYEIRFGVVMAMKYFIDDEHIDELFSLIDGISSDAYYVRMGVAWTLSYCFVKYPERTKNYLLNSYLDDFTYNKSIQKIIESYRVNDEQKNQLRAMRNRRIIK